MLNADRYPHCEADMKADERHKLKTNQLATFLSQVPEKLRANSRLLTGIGVLVVLAVAVTLILVWYRGRKETDAWNAEASAVNKLNADLGVGLKANALTDAIDGLNKVAVDYPNKPPVTCMARYYEGWGYLAEAQARRGELSRVAYRDNLDRAREALTQAVAQPYHPLFTPLAKVLLGDIAQDQGQQDPRQFAKAAELYSEVAGDGKADEAVKQMALRKKGLMPAHPTPVRFVPGLAPATQSDLELSPYKGMTTTAAEAIIPIPAASAPAGRDSGEPAPRGATTRKGD
jgi:hypothetical protein